MRNGNTDRLGEKLTRQYKASGLGPNEFIDTIKDRFDITYLQHHPAVEHFPADDYACFHRFYCGDCVQYYYWESRDEWYCKY